MMAAPIRALVVDDSVAVRRSLGEILAAHPDIQLVGEAADGQEALHLAIELRPDVILLDLEMPRMDGFTFLRFLRAQAGDIPVLVLSRHSGRSDVRRALDLAAQGFVPKPALGATGDSAEVRTLLDQIRAIARAQVRAAGEPRQELRSSALPFRVALLGASTGGPAAIQRVLEAMPEGLPLCVVVAQHMPGRFTPAFAERLNRSSAFSVSEAREGDELAPGLCLVAPGGQSLALAVGERSPIARLAANGKERRYVPSIDLLFSSAAEVLGTRALGIVLTGMGDDGCTGLKDLRRVGARTLAEAQETAVVFGMPKAAIESGGAQEVLPLSEIIRSIIAFGRGW